MRPLAHLSPPVPAVVLDSNTNQGHLEFFLCNADDMTDPDGVVTQGCFNMHPLDRASDDDSASRIDPNHVGRYFLDPSCRASETDQSMPAGAFSGDVVTARYQLPDGLTCTRFIVQMVYCEFDYRDCMSPLLVSRIVGRMHTGTRQTPSKSCVGCRRSENGNLNALRLFHGLCCGRPTC